MKKVIVGLLAVILAILSVQPVQAEDQKVLAIIDTAIDSTRPEFKDKIIYEACYASGPAVGCMNGTTFMEGNGSANAKVWPSVLNTKKQVNDTYHGYIMTRIAIESNPNIKIVFVRYADVSSQGNSINQPGNLSKAIEWVAKNASKYSIDAVSISQTALPDKSLALCLSDLTAINSINSLDAQSIPVFSATGNDSTLKSIKPVGFPACINTAVAVGAVAALSSTPTLYNNFAALTNRDTRLDIVAPVDFSFKWLEYNQIKEYPANGTSVSTAIAASKYLASSITRYSDFQSSLPKVLGYPYISK